MLTVLRIHQAQICPELEDKLFEVFATSRELFRGGELKWSSSCMSECLTNRHLVEGCVQEVNVVEGVRQILDALVELSLRYHEARQGAERFEVDSRYTNTMGSESMIV